MYEDLAAAVLTLNQTVDRLVAMLEGTLHKFGIEWVEPDPTGADNVVDRWQDVRDDIKPPYKASYNTYPSYTSPNYARDSYSYRAPAPATTPVKPSLEDAARAEFEAEYNAHLDRRADSQAQLFERDVPEIPEDYKLEVD